MMMLDIIRIIYREIHYQMIKDNPSAVKDPKKVEESLKWSGSLKLGVGLQSLAYLLFGAMFGIGVFMTKEEYRGIVFSSYLIVAFIMALYTTSLSSGYLLSSRAIDPLKPLPLRNFNSIVSATLLLECLPAFFLLLPSALALKKPLSILLGIGWVLVAILLGHAIGVLLQVKFGGVHVGKGGIIKAIAKTIGQMFFIAIFFVLQLVSRFVLKNVEYFAPVFQKYPIIFPMAAATVVEPLRGFIMFMLYAIPTAFSYVYSIKKINEILEGIKVYGKAPMEYSLSITSPILAFVQRDYKMIFRRNSYLGAFLSPIGMSLYFIWNLFKDGFPLEETGLMIVVISSLGVILLDIVFKMEMEGLDILLNLPITKRQFLLAKALTISLSPLTFSIVFIVLASWSNGLSALYLLPLLSTPFLTSSIGVSYVGFKIEGVEIPELRIYDGIALLIMVFVPVVIAGIVFFLIPLPISTILLGATYLLTTLILLWRMR
ncbi:hypothetical protein [Pyrococcus sp. ST04]|uniref:hypothetical protein n=1 Tax=Pyrococcus sp. ST04 TaxID=1183377 RepID=UPI0002605E0A|nr:hypothetical protein [Pyrococcus sp. ST04]AFK22548.1 hypothetical protein Py04_0966 [Pyrococcus sp. ST04]